MNQKDATEWSTWWFYFILNMTVDVLLNAIINLCNTSLYLLKKAPSLIIFSVHIHSENITWMENNTLSHKLSLLMENT